MCGGAHPGMKCKYIYAGANKILLFGRCIYANQFLLYVRTVLYRFHIRICMFCTAVNKSVRYAVIQYYCVIL